MYAVIETGGKQYRVELGTELAVERLEGLPGSTINFDRVLLVADGDNAQIGTPTVADALVTADVLRQDRGEKLIVFKYRPKARHRSKKGHRQEQTVLRVADIRFKGRSAADEAGMTKTDEQAERKVAEAEAKKKAAADQALAAKLAAETAAKADATKATEASTDDKPAAKTTVRKPAAPKATAKEPAAKATTKTATSKTASAKAAPKEPAKAADSATDKPKTTRSRASSPSTKKDE